MLIFDGVGLLIDLWSLARSKKSNTTECFCPFWAFLCVARIPRALPRADCGLPLQGVAIRCRHFSASQMLILNGVGLQIRHNYTTTQLQIRHNRHNRCHGSLRLKCYLECVFKIMFRIYSTAYYYKYYYKYEFYIKFQDRRSTKSYGSLSSSASQMLIFDGVGLQIQHNCKSNTTEGVFGQE